MVDYGCCARMRARLSLWFAYLFGSIIIPLVRLSRWLALVVLPVVVRLDVARGTRGIVVRLNVARVLVLSLISSRLRESCYMRGLPTVFGFLSFLSLLTQPFVFYPTLSLAIERLLLQPDLRLLSCL
jgi:hypothetical protein